MASPDLERGADGYDAKDLGMTSLIGRFVKGAKIFDSDVVVLNTDLGPMYLTWSGDCCASCYLANISGADNLMGAKILEIETAEWKRKENDDFDVVETMGTKIKTEKGYVTLETRLEHNGFYCGQIAVSDKAPIDNYGSYLKVPSESDLKELKDF